MFRKLLIFSLFALGWSLATPQEAQAWRGRGVYVRSSPVRVAVGRPRVVAPVRRGFYGPRFVQPRGVTVVVGGGGWYGW
jgi:hypothetical protein